MPISEFASKTLVVLSFVEWDGMGKIMLIHQFMYVLYALIG